jgi:uncharacterized protein YegL
MNQLDQLINHIVLVLDASSSMSGITKETIKVADSLVASLAERSTEMGQETRITVYTFNTKVVCKYYDKDVLRLPSLAGMYRPAGATALIDATMQSIKELDKTATLYGNHAFLVYVLTDGEENSSTFFTKRHLINQLNALAENWTVACLVPDENGVRSAQEFGFPPGNISKWDTTAQGITEVGQVIRQATDNFMVNRAKGVRGSKNIFNLDASTVQVNKLEKLDSSRYTFIKVGEGTDQQIRDVFEAATGLRYRKGEAYYQLTKTEEVQPQKNIVIVDKETGQAYAGPSARTMLGLPNDYVSVRATDHPKYDIFIQSTSVNRKLVPNTAVLVMK